MQDGVLHSQYFVLYLTEGVFARYFCKVEIRMVSALRMRALSLLALAFLLLYQCCCSEKTRTDGTERRRRRHSRTGSP